MPNLSTLSNITLNPMLHEASKLKSQREPDSMYKMWSFVNKCASAVNKASSNINQLNRDIKSVLNERHKLGFDLFPFKIYILPDMFRGNNLNGTSWRTVRVRGGFVFTDQVATSSYVNGTDMFQNYAYANTFTGTASYTSVVPTSYDITLPTDQADNPVWFWIENAGSSSYYLRYGNNPVSASLGNPTPWTSFPDADADYIPVGLVDAYSSASSQQILIRQFLTSDVLLSGGSSPSNWYDYNESASYKHGDFVWVDYNNQYTRSFTDDTPPLCPGCFYVAKDVPQNSGSLRPPINYYFPLYPNWSNSTSSIVTKVTDVSSPYLSQSCNQIFFEPISPMTLLSLCIDGVSTNAAVCATISGSFFDIADLAYTGT